MMIEQKYSLLKMQPRMASDAVLQFLYPGYVAGQVWIMKPGNLEGGFLGRYQRIVRVLGASYIGLLT